jgi:hypothetical protein
LRQTAVPGLAQVYAELVSVHLDEDAHLVVQNLLLHESVGIILRVFLPIELTLRVTNDLFDAAAFPGLPGELHAGGLKELRLVFLDFLDFLNMLAHTIMRSVEINAHFVVEVRGEFFAPLVFLHLYFKFLPLLFLSVSENAELIRRLRTDLVC